MDNNSILPSIEKLHNVFSEGNPVYLEYLSKISFNTAAKRAEKIKIARTLRYFYGSKFPNGIPFPRETSDPFIKALEDVFEQFENHFAESAFLGEAENPGLKVFVKEGNELYLQTIRSPNLNSYPLVFNISKLVSSSEREPWTGDYRSLAERVLKERGGYSIMLIKAPPNSQDQIAKLVSVSFNDLYASQMKRKALEQ